MTDCLIVIREATVADAAAIARVHVRSWRETYRGIVPEEYLADLSRERRMEMWTQVIGNPERGQVVYVAEDPDAGIVGFANGGPDWQDDPIYRGELRAIYILADYHGRGLGRRLTGAVVGWLRARGYLSLLIWVLADNPARGFYEALGGSEVRRTTIEIGGKSVEEVAYGWDDVTSLVSGTDVTP